MQFQSLKNFLNLSASAAFLLMSGAYAVAQNLSVSLTASRSSTTLTDGSTVPMWGLACNSADTGASCSALNQNSGGTWAPPVITVPVGSNLTINLTNNLPVPTSLTIVGQLGGGIGNPRKVPSPQHADLPTTWAVAGDTSGPVFTPPSQSDRVQSFGDEVGAGQTLALSPWNSLRPGTYLIESGTHPSIQGPMGLYGVLVVTTAPAAGTAGNAYPSPASQNGVLYDSDAVVLLSEIDPIQNAAVDKAVMTPGFSETAVWTLRDSISAITVDNGGSGYTSAPNVVLNGGGGTGATATATIDGNGKVNAIKVVNGGTGYTSAPSVTFTGGGSGVNAAASAVLSQGQSGCGNVAACYSPVVNYSPRYFLVNGQAFNKVSPGAAALSVPGTVTSGNVLLRFVNAGLRMHIPSVVGLDMSLVAEDGNVLPGKPRVQNEAFLAAGKVMDVVVNPLSTSGNFTPASYAIYDRELSLSTNNQRDGGMQTYLLVNGGVPPSPTNVSPGAVAMPDTYYLVPGSTLNVGTPSQGVLANDVNVYGVQLLSSPTAGTLTSFNANGTFTYVPNAGTTTDSFTYYVNGDNANFTTVTLAPCSQSPCLGGAPVAKSDAFASKVATTLNIHRPGVLDNDSDPSGHPLKAQFDATCTVGAGSLLNASQISLGTDGSFTVSGITAPGTYKFCYHAVNSQNATSDSVDVEVTFPTGSGITFQVQDTKTGTPITDYKWVIEEDTNFYSAPGVTTPPPQQTLATSFHKSFMPLVASGCIGSLSCGDGQTVLDSNPASPTYGQHITVDPQPSLDPGQVALEPGKRYYISVLPGDAANPAITANVVSGHTMGGSSIAADLPSGSTIKILAEQNALPPAQLSVIVFEDNNPTNGDIDGAEESQGLGGFQIVLQDVAGATGDATGQMDYDMFNMPLTNALNGAIDSATHLNMCPLSNTASDGAGGKVAIGQIITCPALEADGKTPSPVAGQALIRNLYPDRFDVTALPGSARIAAGENWIQTSTLEGTHWNDAFAKAGEPSYFQEYGPPGFHSFIGFINPAHIAAVNKAQKGTHSITGKVTNLHMSRPSSEQLFDSNSHDPIGQSTCYVDANSQNGVGAAVAFAACDADGNFTLTGLPNGQYQVAVWDQWQDQIINYKSVTVADNDVKMDNFTVFSWFDSLYYSSYIDQNQNGIREDGEAGLAQVPVRIRYRNGQISNTNTTDAEGNAAFNEVFPLFNWYVVESDTTRYKGTGIHTVNDAGGAVDTDGPYAGYLSSTESFSLPAENRIPGSVYCDKADCATVNLSTNPTGGGPGGSTGRIDQGTTLSEGLQAFISQPQFIDFGKTPYSTGENGGIVGHVVYATTRPFDDPQLLFQPLWSPLVPRVTVNLYREDTAADGTQSLTMVDSTQTTSWDDWANGINATTGKPNMNCPGQDPNDPFFTYTLGSGNQYKCYDSMHNWNQMQPAPYDGRFQFPSDACTKPGASFTTLGGKVVACTTKQNPATSDPANKLSYPAILPAGKYVVEVEVPTGYEIVKEEDKNILIGDSYIAPVTQQFAGLGNIFILPDQAAIVDAQNPNNPQNSTTDMGRTNLGDFGPGGLTVMPAPCVGDLRVVPDYLSLYPQAFQVAPFAGASRPLCDRRELTLGNQMQAQMDFFVFTPTPISSRFTGMILDDLASEFNAANPDFGEKFAVPFVPVSFRDFNGVEVSRVYADQFGMFNGLIYSTFDVNPPNPTGYAPNMMITCMNDPGPIPDPNHPGQMMTDPHYNPNYSNFCYTWPFMPGNESYMDTPVLPVAAYASGYNPPDCAYPDATPAIKEVDGDGEFGPYLASNGALKLTIKALGDLDVPNNAYAGPSASSGIASKSTITRHYGFGNKGPLSTVTLPSVLPNGNPVLLNITNWTDTEIDVTIPVGTNGAPLAKTGELIITATVTDPVTSQNKAVKSVDSVTVTIEDPTATGYRAPKYLHAPAANTATDVGLPHPIQDAIDAAQPGDLLMLGPGSYPELVIMWKPIRLQGVGAASVTINAAKYPTQKLDQWRPKVNCFFGLDGQGNPLNGPNAECPAAQLNGADPLPGQEITGGVTALEPSVLTDVQGPGITILARNINANGNNCSPTSRGYSQGNFSCADDNITRTNHHVAHARIDGITLTGSDAGGAIYANGWAHNLEISNDRIHGNSGTFAGGILIGQPYLEGATGRGPFGYNKDVLIHHNSITHNGTVESNLGQSGAGGGISLCTGTDNYKVNFNFICGNYSEGDGGGIGHIGLSWNGAITNNQILFNESFIQAQTTSGGGIAIEGETGTGTTLSLGTGSVLVDSNLILGNDAQGGHGGGIRLQDVNGQDIASAPNFAGNWWKVTLQNNIVTNNVAGWSGGGISLANTVNSLIINNTVSSNDSTATAGPLFNSSPTTTVFQPAGISSEPHSAPLCAALAGAAAAYRCTGAQAHPYSNPSLQNDIVWKNRSFYFTSQTDPNNVMNITNRLMPTLTQSTTGECPSGANYWDLGVLGQPQTNPTRRLSPSYSVLTDSTGYAATNKNGDPLLLRQYCNGSRVPPQTAGDLMTPQTPFTIQPTGAEDEGGNWVNLRFGPLSLFDSAQVTTPGTPQATIGDYHVQQGSSAVNEVPCNVANNVAPSYDFDGNRRPVPSCPSQNSTATEYDAGAIELQTLGGAIASVTGGPVDFGNVPVNTTSTSKTITLQNTGSGDLTGIIVAVTAPFSRTGGSCTTTLTAGTTCTIQFVFQPTAVAPATGSVTITGSVAVTGSPVALIGTGVQQKVSAALTPSSWSPTQTRNCPGTTIAQRLACTFDPSQAFTLTNTGNVTLNNISTVTLTGANTADYSIVGVLTSCGTGANQLVHTTSLAPGATCTVTLQFKPLTAEARGTKNAQVNVTDAAGTQSSTLSGTAN